MLAAAALLHAQHIDFNAPADTTAALLREAAATHWTRPIPRCGPARWPGWR